MRRALLPPALFSVVNAVDTWPPRRREVVTACAFDVSPLAGRPAVAEVRAALVLEGGGRMGGGADEADEAEGRACA